MSEHHTPIDHTADQAAQRRAQQKERMDELRAAVAQCVQDVFTPDKYQAFLRTVSHFPDYSFNNQMLLAVQRPDATKVMTYGDWEKQGRNVSKGEKGSKIIRPRQSTQTVDGKPTTRTFFNIVTVFDAAQTTGKPLPDPTLPSPEMLLQALKRISPELNTESPAAAIQALAIKHTKEKAYAALAEPSIAYTVGLHYGLPMQDDLLKPTAASAKAMGPDAQQSLLKTISKTAGNFVLSIDHHLRHIQQERETETQQTSEWQSAAVKADLLNDRRPSIHEQLRRSPVHAGKPKKSVQSHAEMEH